jgi:hypothetical protein
VVNFVDVKEQVSLPDAVKVLGLVMTEKEGVFRGACPSCNAGGARALVVTPGKGFFCFHAKKGGDVISLAAHIKGIELKAAAEFLAGKGTKTPSEPAPSSQPGGLKPLDYLDPTHEKSLAIVGEETARVVGMGYAPRGIMRGTVAVPLYDLDGTLAAYVGIEEDGRYRFPSGFPYTAHIFGAQRIITNEVYLLPTVEDCLKALENGIDQAICFFTNSIDPIQLKALADLLEDKKATLQL